MKIAVCGRNLDDLHRYMNGLPLQVVRADPDVVICYGGDGSLLGAEREFPGVPKCPIRDSRSNGKCPEHGELVILRRLIDGVLQRKSLLKLEAVTSRGEREVGLNDVFISKSNIASAVRYRLWLNEEPYGHQIVGDGLVVSTPFGSTGYYRSITHSLFRVGIGIAFNNSTEPIDHLVTDDATVIRMEIIRGPAVLLADNNPVRIPLNKGDQVTVVKAPVQTIIMGLDEFRCPECARLRYRNLA